MNSRIPSAYHSFLQSAGGYGLIITLIVSVWPSIPIRRESVSGASCVQSALSRPPPACEQVQRAGKREGGVIARSRHSGSERVKSSAAWSVRRPANRLTRRPSALPRSEPHPSALAEVSSRQSTLAGARPGAADHRRRRRLFSTSTGGGAGAKPAPGRPSTARSGAGSHTVRFSLGVQRRGEHQPMRRRHHHASTGVMGVRSIAW